VPSLSRVLLQRADGTAKLRSLAGIFTPVMIDSEAGMIRTYRLIEAGRDEAGPFYTYSEDENLRLPVVKPSELEPSTE
jgi:hypothetical protein